MTVLCSFQTVHLCAKCARGQVAWRNGAVSISRPRSQCRPGSPTLLQGAQGNVLKPSPAFQSVQTVFKAIMEPRTFFLNPFQTRTKMMVHDIFAKHAGSGMDRLYIYVKHGETVFQSLLQKGSLCASQK